MPDQQQKIKGVADIVFLIDVTASMQPCIDGLKNNIQTFVTSLTTKDGQNLVPIKDWRARALGFRDFTVDSEPFLDNPFVDNLESFRSQLTALRAEGGGDTPESLLEALHKVTTMPSTDKGAPVQADRWRYRGAAARAVIVFTDAPYKPTMVEPRGGRVEDVINILQANKILLTIFAPDFPCYQPLEEVNRAVWHRVTGGTDPQDSMVKFTSNPENFRKTLEKLGKTLSATVAATPLTA